MARGCGIQRHLCSIFLATHHVVDSSNFISSLDSGQTKIHKMPNDNQFQVATTSLVLSVPPIFAGNPRGGVEEILDSMIMRYLHSTLPSKLSSNSVRYVPALQGVVLSHSNLRFLNNTATIRGDSPFLVCTVVFDATVWSPRVGIKLCTFLFCNILLGPKCIY